MPDLTQAQRNAVSELLRISKVIGDLGSRFDAAGHRLYLVGGSVRDAMLGGLGHDLDFTTSAHPDETHAILRDFTPATWDIGRDFGTIGAMKKEGGKEWQIEVTTFRADAYEPGSRKPVVAFGERIEEDLVRRDFTVNAMAVDIVAGEFVDPWGGLRDLADGVLRTPAPAEVSFGDDPLRMMRAARFASRLGFRVAPEVQDAMREMAERITIVSAERVQAELTGLLLTDSPREGLDLLVRTGVAEHFLPELPALRLERDEHMRHKDVYAHSLTVLEQAIDLEKARGHQPDIVNRLAALLHDIGKAPTKKFVKGTGWTFHGHEFLGSKMVKTLFQRLKLPLGKDMKYVQKMVKLSSRPIALISDEASDSALRRMLFDAGEDLEDLFTLCKADITTKNAQKQEKFKKNFEYVAQKIKEVEEKDHIRNFQPPITGEEIMAMFSLAPGREIGILKERVKEAILEGNIPNDKEAAREFVLQEAKRMKLT